MAIPSGFYANKVVKHGTGEVIIDLTGDDILPANVDSGVKFHDRTGAMKTGTSTRDADTGDANALPGEILSGRTAYVKGFKVTGTMPNNGAVAGKIATRDGDYVVPAGYHDGSGTVAIADAEKAKLIGSNILDGVSILGVTGTLAPASGVTAQTKSVTPSFTAQTVLPDAGTDYLSQVDVGAIPVSETLNESGGYTVTIG